MHRRRRPQAPTAPSPAALIAASAVFRPPTPSLAAAAAGTALRRASASASTPDHRPGTIPTKRMLQRRSSYDTDLPRRSPSSSSLSSRRFRKTPDRPAAPTPRTSARRTTNIREWISSSSSSSDDDDDHFRRTASVRSTRSFPTTMRGAHSPPQPKPSSIATTMRGGRHRQRRCSDPVIHPPHHEDHIDSSELESIAENADTKTPPLRIPEEEDSSSGPEDTFEFTRTGVGGRAGELFLIPTKHVPLPRSVSPAKSALRHGAHSEVGLTRRVRVSFSDEDSVASFSAYSWPALAVAVDEAPRTLPAFASVGRGGEVGVSMASPAASESGGPGVGVPEVLTAPEVLAMPKVVLTMPTPSSEELPRGAAAIVDSGQGAARDMRPDAGPGPDSDSDSGDSIYEDAYEDLPPPAVLNTPPVVLNAPLNAPPLPPDLLRPRPLQPHPSPSSSTASSFSPPSSSDTASIHSVSSFRRLTPRPRPRRPGMLRSLRAAPPPPLTLPFAPPPPPPHSPLSDLHLENDITTALLSPVGTKLQRNRTWSGSSRGAKREGGGGGFWRVFSKQEAESGRSVIMKKSVRAKDVWAGGGGVTTVIEGGSAEVTGGKEEMVKKKKKGFGRLKRLLRLG